MSRTLEPKRVYSTVTKKVGDVSLASEDKIQLSLSLAVIDSDESEQEKPLCRETLEGKGCSHVPSLIKR